MAHQNVIARRRTKFTADEQAKLTDWLVHHRKAFEKGAESAELSKRVDGAGIWAEGTRKYYVLSAKVIDYLLSHVTD